MGAYKTWKLERERDLKAKYERGNRKSRGELGNGDIGKNAYPGEWTERRTQQIMCGSFRCLRPQGHPTCYFFSGSHFRFPTRMPGCSTSPSPFPVSHFPFPVTIKCTSFGVLLPRSFPCFPLPISCVPFLISRSQMSTRAWSNTPTLEGSADFCTVATV